MAIWDYAGSFGITESDAMAATGATVVKEGEYVDCMEMMTPQERSLWIGHEDEILTTLETRTPEEAAVFSRTLAPTIQEIRGLSLEGIGASPGGKANDNRIRGVFNKILHMFDVIDISEYRDY